MTPYPYFGILRTGILEDDLLTHLMAEASSHCGLANPHPCPDALSLQLKKDLKDIRV